MPFLLDQAADLTNKAIQKIWLKSSELDDKNFEKYVNVSTGVKDYLYRDSSLSGLGTVSFHPENANIVEVQPVQGFDQLLETV